MVGRLVGGGEVGQWWGSWSVVVARDERFAVFGRVKAKCKS